MRALKKSLFTCAAISAIVAATTSVQAASLDFLENWTLNLGNAGQGLVGSVTGIDQILYKGLTHVSIYDADRSGSVSVGDTFKVDGLMYTTDFYGNGQSRPNQGLNTNYELTMKFSVGGQFTTTNSDGSLTFAHNTAGGGGSLDLYLDNLGTGVKANTVQAVGFTDGTNIASFALNTNTPDSGGVYYPVPRNGSDDAFFDLVNQVASVFQNNLGANLDSAFHAVWTRSDFSTRSVTPPNVTNWEAYFGPGSAAQNPLNFFVDENGDARIVTPEPSTFALLGLGLVGAAVWGRRKKA